MKSKQELEQAAQDYAGTPISGTKSSGHLWAERAFQAGANWQSEQSQWISIEEELPGCLAMDYFSDGTKVWVLGENKIWISKVMDSLMWKYYMIENGVTHWMPFDALPLPKPPLNNQP